MTKPIQTIIVALLAIMITSCSAIREAVDSGKAINLSAIKIGMTKAEVKTALNKKPDNVIASKNYPENKALVEVVQYSRWGDANAGINNTSVVPVIMESYWLYFVNDKLDKWEIAAVDRRPRI